jgi:hypothetical protein
MNAIAEFAFYLLGGVPIANTGWFILWIVFFAILIVIVYIAALFAHDMGYMLVALITATQKQNRQ